MSSHYSPTTDLNEKKVEVFIDTESAVEMLNKTGKKRRCNGQVEFKREYLSVETGSKNLIRTDNDDHTESTGYVYVPSPLPPKKRFCPMSLVNINWSNIFKEENIPQLNSDWDTQQKKHHGEQVNAIQGPAKVAPANKKVSQSKDNKTGICIAVQAKNHEEEHFEVKVNLISTKHATELTVENPWSEMSTSDINEFIKTEAGKRLPNWDLLSKAMTKTYESTRKPIYDNAVVRHVRVKDILKFPGLRHYQMVKEEYGRILGNIDRMRKFEEELEPKLLSALQTNTLQLSRKERQLRLWARQRSGVTNTKNDGMLQFCYQHVGKDAVFTKLCKFLKPGQIIDSSFKILDTPTIVLHEEDMLQGRDNGEIYIFVDCKKVLRVPNMYEAVLSVFACYYVFNIVYNAELEKLFRCFDGLSEKNNKSSREEEICSFCNKNTLSQ